MATALPADLRVAASLGGEMGSRFAAFDWESHPLGPPQLWPAEVRAAVALALASRFPTVLWLGPELRLIYNDAYIPALSEKHPGALGAPAGEVWAEIWDVIGPMLAGVVSTGEATWSDDLLLMLITGGRPQERYFTFTYSPIIAADGSVSGVFCAVSETTERVLGERRLRLLNDLAASLLGAGSTGEVLATTMSVCAPNGADLPFVAAYTKDPHGGPPLFEAATPGLTELLPAVAPTGATWTAAPEIRPEGELIDDLEARLPRLKTVLGGDCPEQALVLPLADAGQDSELAWLVVGLSGHLPLDEQYRGFCSLLADQVSSSLVNVRAHEAERRRAEALAELDAAKTRFFTNISHELRTPLTLLLGPAADALADPEEPLGPAQRHRVEMVVRNAERLLSLVNTLLDFSRIESGTVTACFVPTDLSAETAKLADMFGSAVEQVGLSFRVEVAPLGEAVHVDREMWAKIVLNLLSNALKFTFEGGIVVSLVPIGDAVELSVTDTGVGIEPAEQERLFERFHRVAGVRSRSFEGSGIGLALVSELAALHGGSVGVDSKPGEGSRFWVRIPLGVSHLPPEQVGAAPEAGPQAAPIAAGPLLAEALRWMGEPQGAGSRGGPGAGRGGEAVPLVLVVDDNADMRDYVAQLLRPHYRVVTAADGLEALGAARAETPDLVLSDVMMPNLDGFGLIAALHEDPATTAVPVVFLSARAGTEGAVEGLEAGADDYLAKPFAASELLARVRANLELDRTRRARKALEHNRELLAQAQRLAKLGSWEIDLTTHLVTGSDEFFRLLAVDPGTLATITFDEGIVAFVHPEDRERVAAALDAAAAGGKPFSFEARMRRPDGTEWTARIVGEAIASDGRRPARLRGSIQDIDEQRRAESRLAEAAAEREAAARERDIADRLQVALLPHIEVDVDGLDIATYYRAGAEHTMVGGDWYDVIDLGAGCVAMVMGDVMGRGVHAAAIMGQLRSTVRAFARLGMGPADLLESVDAVVRDMSDEQIVTCVYAIFDASDGTLTFANAGHPPLLVVTPDGRAARSTAATGPPLGTGPLRLEEQQITLEPGTLVALYTDGLVERRHRHIGTSITELQRQLQSVMFSDLRSAVQTVSEALLPPDPGDDVALLLARVQDKATQVNAFTLRVQPSEGAVGRARAAAEAALAGWGIPEDVRADAVLTISELVTNALIHGAPPADLTVRCTRNEVVIEVADRTPTPPRKLRPTETDEFGRGMQMVAYLASRWGTSPTQAGKRVWCTLAVPAGASD